MFKPVHNVQEVGRLVQSPGPDSPKTPSIATFAALSARQLAAAEVLDCNQPDAAQVNLPPKNSGVSESKQQLVVAQANGDGGVGGDDWRGNPAWRMLYPPKPCTPDRLPPDCKPAPAQGHQRGHPSTSAAEYPASAGPGRHVLVQQDSIRQEYNPWLLNLIRRINESNKRKKAAAAAAAAPASRQQAPASCTSITTSPGQLAQPDRSAHIAAFCTLSPASQPLDVHPALVSLLRRLHKLQKYDGLYSADNEPELALKEVFGPGVPVFRMVDDAELSSCVSQVHKAYLLGPGPQPCNKRRHLMRLLQPLVGHYVIQHKLVMKPGTAAHKFAAWKLKEPTLTPAQAARYNSPQATSLEALKEDYNEQDCGEKICGYGTGHSWSEHPALVVNTYQLILKRYKELVHSHSKHKCQASRVPTTSPSQQRRAAHFRRRKPASYAAMGSSEDDD